MENNKSGINGIKYFLQPYIGIEFRHGGIGNLDVEKILLQQGVQPIKLPDQGAFLLYTKRWLAMRSILRHIKPGDIVFCQFPVYPRMYQLLIRKLAKKGIPLIAFLADIDGLKDGDPELLEKEMHQYRLCRYFIVHNQKMEDWLRSKLGNVQVSQLGPFDFLTIPNTGSRTANEGINFSGNLAKSGFLGELNQLAPIQFHVYGQGMATKYDWPKNLHYHGVFLPYDMPRIIKGSFGLIWDGDSIHGASGPLGQYMTYINHHKLSLYILAGLPIIAPAFAGSAPFIKEKGIGWLVQDMGEVPALLEKITDQEYQLARENMLPIAMELSQGNQLRNALKKLLNF